MFYAILYLLIGSGLAHWNLSKGPLIVSRWIIIFYILTWPIVEIVMRLCLLIFKL